MKVPAIQDGDVRLFESHAILRYLKSTRNAPDHWYPEKDYVRRAKIDEYLDWSDAGVRAPSLRYLISRVISLTGSTKPLF